MRNFGPAAMAGIIVAGLVNPTVSVAASAGSSTASGTIAVSVLSTAAGASFLSEHGSALHEAVPVAAVSTAMMIAVTPVLAAAASAEAAPKLVDVTFESTGRGLRFSTRLSRQVIESAGLAIGRAVDIIATPIGFILAAGDKPFAYHVHGNERTLLTNTRISP